MFSIYTWGWGSNLYETLTAVQFFIANPYYFIGTALVIGLCVVAFKSIFSSIDEKHALVGFFVIIGLFLTPGNQTFVIEDEATGQAQPISNLPLGIGFFLVIESNFERDLSAMAKNAFSTPNSIAMENVGIGFSMTASLELEEAMPRDDLLVQTFDHYVNNCLLSALATGEKTMTTITNSGNLVGDLAVSNTFETLVFDIADPTGRQESCQTAWANISTRVDVESNAFIQNKIAPLTGLPVDRVNDGLAGTSNLLYGVSASGKDLVLQKMSKNLLNNGLMAVGQIVGGDTATAALMAAQTEQQTKGSWIGAGLQAQKTLPMIRIIGTSLLISSIVILAWLSIAMASFRVMAFVLVGLTTLATWQPLATIINYQYYTQLEKTLQPISGGALAPIYSTGQVNDAIQNYLANLMWWYSAIPMFSYTILTMSGMGMMYMMRDASSTSTGASTGTSIGNGIVQMGNTTVANNTQDNDRVGTGTYVGAGGVTTKVNSNGATETTNVGITSDGTAYGVKTMNSPAGSSQVVSTDGAGTIGINGKGEIFSFSNANWNAGVDAAQQYQHAQTVATEQTAETAFNQQLGTTVTDMMRNGSDVTNSSTLEKVFGLDKTTATNLSRVSSEVTANAFTSAFGEGEQTEILKRAGVSAGIGADGKITIGTPGEGVFGSGASASVNANGRVELMGTRADGTSFSAELSSEESKRYMEQFEKTLSKSFSEKEGLGLNIAKNMKVTEGQEHSELKNAQNTYLQAHTETERSSELFNRVEQFAQSHKVDLAPKILNEFIQNDSHLAAQWNAPGSDHARIAAEAANRIQNAQLDANNNQVDAQNFRQSIGNVYSEFAHANGLVDTVNDRITNGQVDAKTRIEEGKDNIQNFKVKAPDMKLDTQMDDYLRMGGMFRGSAMGDLNSFENKYDLNIRGEVDKSHLALSNEVIDHQTAPIIPTNVNMNQTPTSKEEVEQMVENMMHYYEPPKTGGQTQKPKTEER